MEKNKTGKYLKYAIGEIVLVVIGILIALSINNWNQERIAATKEKAYLDNLQRDLENQIASIDVQLSYEQKYLDNAKLLLDQYQKSAAIVIDSTTSARINILTERKTFIRTDPTYEDLISTGNIGLLKNIYLRNELIEYYQELKRIEKILQNNNTLLVDEMFGHNIIHSIYIGKTPSERLFAISNDLLKDPELELVFINLIDFREKIAGIHIQNMNELRSKTNRMLDLVRIPGS